MQTNPNNAIQNHLGTPQENTPEHSAIDSVHRVVNVCAVAIRNREGLVLTVRKKGSEGFMMPGGKPEPDEAPVQTACREVSEEIGLITTPERMHYLGTLEAPALNEAGFTVCAKTFEYAPTEEQQARLATLSPRAEITELRWVNPAMTATSDVLAQAPLNTERIFPLLASTPQP